MAATIKCLDCGTEFPVEDPKSKILQEGTLAVCVLTSQVAECPKCRAPHTPRISRVGWKMNWLKCEQPAPAIVIPHGAIPKVS